jgi:hypothetical protein
MDDIQRVPDRKFMHLEFEELSMSKLFLPFIETSI